eukprot:CAMPEP_0194344064 /NCGR_PEP_ID=MMETSP0171-20130528/99742_1 /TAXON_ID=218684 /ORGANISM="Corethron pennatum, Strain L29A3" /LENGTH=81 /DNA_ID=CAMNT_0039110561 /DNA_START=181 /DNA_END=424 /DNA_ORIENTATION=-
MTSAKNPCAHTVGVPQSQNFQYAPQPADYGRPVVQCCPTGQDEHLWVDVATLHRFATPTGMKVPATRIDRERNPPMASGLG